MIGITVSDDWNQTKMQSDRDRQDAGMTRMTGITRMQSDRNNWDDKGDWDV